MLLPVFVIIATLCAESTYGYGVFTDPDTYLKFARTSQQQAKNAADTAVQCAVTDLTKKCTSAPQTVATKLQTSSQALMRIPGYVPPSNVDTKDKCAGFSDLIAAYVDDAKSYAQSFEQFACRLTESATVADNIRTSLLSAEDTYVKIVSWFENITAPVPSCASYVPKVQNASAELKKNNDKVANAFSATGRISCLAGPLAD